METKLIYGLVEQVEADAVAIVVYEDGEGPAFAKSWHEELRASGEFTGKPGELAVLHQPQGLKAKRLVAVGGGKREKFDAAALRKAVGSAVRALKQKGVKRLAWMLENGSVEAVVEGAILGNYEPDMHKPSSDAKPLEVFDVVAAAKSAEIEHAFKRGVILAEAQNFTRDLANEPSNRMTPAVMAERAMAMAQEYRLDCEVLDQDRMRQLGMGSLLGVAQGSDAPPALIVVRYHPPGKAKSDDHLALIGKGVTFDSGGISIKPAEGMEKMKYDMCGGAAVLGAMRAIAQLKPSVAVTAFVPAVENMLNGRAQRPGDIVKSLSGKTIEVLNTDAEGRLVLADVLWYCQDRFKPKLMIDLATLTGAVIVALGHENAGLFANNDQLADRLIAAGKAAGEHLWRLPMGDTYDRAIDSDAADVKNIAGDRGAGSTIGAQFLKRFVNNVPWAHLDIAGVAWSKKDAPTVPKGATAFGVRLLDRFVADHNEKG